MDDSFDEMTVPDDWMDIISSGKRSHEESQNEALSPAKQLKQSSDQQNEGKKSPPHRANCSEKKSLANNGHHDARDDNGHHNAHDGNTFDLTNNNILDDKVASVPSASLNKSDSINSSQETIPILTTDTLEDTDSTQTKIGNLDYTLTVITNSKPSNDEPEDRVGDITPSTNDPKPDIQKASSVVRDAKNLKCFFPDVEEKKIYDMLIEERPKENRLEEVSTKLLELPKNNYTETCLNNAFKEEPEESTIFKDVDTVMKEIPSADANKVYALLESMLQHPDRVQYVIGIIGKETDRQVLSLGEHKQVLIRKESSGLDVPVLKNDLIFHDMRVIAKMFPNKDRNEIYALLEAHFTKPNRADIVINEFLNADKQDTQISNNNKEQQKHADAAVPDLTEKSLQEDVERLTCLFPDCNPNYLYERLESLKNNPERCHILATELFDNKDYPKIEKELKNHTSEKHTKREFSMEEFLEKFPEPEKTFGDETETVSWEYSENAFFTLKNEFRMLKTGYLRDVFTKHKKHLLPSYQEISVDLVAIPIHARKQHGRFLKQLRARNQTAHSLPNEYFYHELWYTRNEQKLKDYVKEKEINALVKFTEAKENGELYECCCCYDDECMFEDLASCPEGHLFCKVCVLRSTEAAFGEMKSKFPCLTGECEQNLTLSTLQSIVPPNLFSKIVCRIQEEEVQQANIPDMVTCPFCPFATIMPNQDDKVLKCLNPQCLKESCRLCQEENHIPLKCHEVESKAGRTLRTFIENYIAEAVIRKCHKCGKKFVKDSGCNKMTCSCGATSCYACKAENIDYQHFNKNQRCANTNPETIHQQDMELAATEARNKYILTHPDAVDVELPSDFNEWIQSLCAKAKKHPIDQYVIEQEEEEDSEEEMDEQSSSYDEA